MDKTKSLEEIYINRCLALAKNGLVAAMPNPSVGAIVVCDNKIIGEGYTSPYGGNHAEVNAIQAVKDKSLLSRSTLYVSLEPCSHHGKTPPCCDLIIKNKIPNVIVGTVDSNIKVAGEGIKRLRDSGIDVVVGVLESACRQVNKRFFTFHEKKRPYVILKWAQTEDGFLSPATKKDKKPVWITNVYSRQLVHKWRSEEQAILVGTNTVIEDNPKLDVRDWTGENPVRIVLDQNNRISKESLIFDNCAKSILITASIIDYSKNIAPQILQYLFDNQLQSVIVEGGLQTLQTFIDANLWDEARVFIGKGHFSSGTKAPSISGKIIQEMTIENDKLLIYKAYD
jgi:diaminohydroxyphosphoribosylaminopyrimidine deaminase / 5-amino-6-(5-phosphoribosylamino)uracil reductase